MSSAALRPVDRTLRTIHHTPAKTAAMTTSQTRTMNAIMPDMPHIISMSRTPDAWPCPASFRRGSGVVRQTPPAQVSEHSTCQWLFNCAGVARSWSGGLSRTPGIPAGPESLLAAHPVTDADRVDDLRNEDH